MNEWMNEWWTQEVDDNDDGGSHPEHTEHILQIFGSPVYSDPVKWVSG